MTLRTDFIILVIFVIHATTIVFVIHSPFAALAASPSFNHQEIEMKEASGWEVVPIGESAEDIHDGRKIFFNPYNSTDIAPCTDTNLFKKLPNISSVSYNSNGRTLNSIFWLDRRPLINDYFQSSARTSDLKQVSVHIFVDNIVPSQYSNISKLIAAEKTFLT